MITKILLNVHRYQNSHIAPTELEDIMMNHWAVQVLETELLISIATKPALDTN